MDEFSVNWNKNQKDFKYYKEPWVEHPRKDIIFFLKRMSAVNLCMN